METRPLYWKEKRYALKELNSDERSDVHWEFEGEKIIPKNLAVARLYKTKFKEGFLVNRIRKFTYQAAYKKKIAIYTRDSGVDQDPNEIFKQRFAALESNMKALNTTVVLSIAALNTAVVLITEKKSYIEGKIEGYFKGGRFLRTILRL